MASRSVHPPKSAVRGASAATVVYWALALFLAGAAAFYITWQVSNNVLWVDFFFRVPGSLLSIAFSVVQLLMSLRVCAEFSPGEPLFIAWRLVSLSAVCDLVSNVAQVLSADPRWNPLSLLPGFSKIWSDTIRHVGQTSGGPLRFALLALGLFYALRMYGKTGFLARLRLRDRVLVLMTAAYVFKEFLDLWAALQRGKHPQFAEVLNWPVDPLLCLLLAEAMLLYRSTQQMGAGWVSRTWVAFCVGIALVVLGDSMTWATAYGYLRYPWSNVQWFVWMPAAAAFAVAPIYQLEVIRKASSFGPN